jgi:hypothetical protein
MNKNTFNNPPAHQSGDAEAAVGRLKPNGIEAAGDRLRAQLNMLESEICTLSARIAPFLRPDEPVEKPVPVLGEREHEGSLLRASIQSCTDQVMALRDAVTSLIRRVDE